VAAESPEPARGTIPEPLWAEAIALPRCCPRPVSPASSGSNRTRLKRRRGIPAGIANPARTAAFVEVTAAEPPATAEVEVSRPDGARLRNHLSCRRPCPCVPRADLPGGPLMLQLTPTEPHLSRGRAHRWRKGIDSLAAVCRQVLGDNPLGGPSTCFAIAQGGPAGHLCKNLRFGKLEKSIDENQ